MEQNDLLTPLQLRIKTVLKQMPNFKTRFEMLSDQIKVASGVCLLASIIRNKTSFFSISDVGALFEGIFDEAEVAVMLSFNESGDILRRAKIKGNGYVRTGIAMKNDGAYDIIHELMFGGGEELAEFIAKTDAKKIGLEAGSVI